MSTLGGSSAANPWCLLESGNLVMQARLDIRYGPDSTIIHQPTHGGVAARNDPPGPSRAVDRLRVALWGLRAHREAHEDRVQEGIQLHGRLYTREAREQRAALEQEGAAAILALPLELPQAAPALQKIPPAMRLPAQVLYLDEARPLDMDARELHHRCGIFWAVKSHPVSYVA
ncbi:hypothetical protein DFH07DRAFT_970017 [Mycena maculata]|uniref:Uncharacterized protein n=1 Tax=Mycena maculata TaxID=230809 RepID=A0AAD7HUE8_9AGAR|nr:hypothetical protein DFH07DRAFT_970017 [Mycena maculata]